jgi:WD40 repeat protein
MKPRQLGKLLALSLPTLVLLVALLCRSTSPGLPLGPTPLAVLEGHRFPVQALTFDREGSILSSAAYYYGAPGTGTEVIAWDLQASTPLAKRIEPLSNVLCLRFTPDGQGLAATQNLNSEGETASARQSSLWLWEAAGSHERGRRLVLPWSVNALAFSQDGSQLATVDHENQITIRDTVQGQLRVDCKRPAEAVYGLTFSPDGTRLATSSWEGPIRLWDTASGEERSILREHSKPVFALAFSPDGHTLASGDLAGNIKLWDVAEGTVRARLREGEEEVAAIAFASNGGTLAVASGRTVWLWDVNTCELLARLEGHQGKVICLTFSPEGTLLASGSYDKTVRVWRLAAAEPLSRLRFSRPR